MYVAEGNFLCLCDCLLLHQTVIISTTHINPLSANPTKSLSLNCFSVFDHFMGLALKGVMTCSVNQLSNSILEGNLIIKIYFSTAILSDSQKQSRNFNWQQVRRVSSYLL